MRKRLGVFVAVLLSCATAAFSQHLSYGVVAGTALTDDFDSFYEAPIGSGPPDIIKSGGKGVIVGPMLEWRLSSPFSVELDGLYRELRFEDARGGAHNPTVTWEFPILAKYRPFSYRVNRFSLRPFLEAGPSFRTTGNLNANPSHAGVSAGGGFEFNFKQINIEPTVRYTRWAEDSGSGLHSRPDQIEFLVGFSHASGFDARPFGKRFSLGAVLGVNLSGDYNSTSSTDTNGIDGMTETFSGRAGPRSFLVGPAVEVQLTGGFSIEADAVYRPVRSSFTFSGVVSGMPFTSSGESSLTTWQFPVLAKYTLPTEFLRSRVRPFVEAGPSFRTGGSATHFGVTVGGGISMRAGLLNIAPAVRYSRWQADPIGGLKSNETVLLVGFTF